MMNQYGKPMERGHRLELDAPKSTNGKCWCGCPVRYMHDETHGHKFDHIIPGELSGQAPQSNGKPPQDSTDELEQTKAIQAILHKVRHRLHSSYPDEATIELQALIAAERHRYAAEVLEGLSKRIDYNAHDLGEMGRFIRVAYLRNFIEEAIAALNQKETKDAAS